MLDLPLATVGWHWQGRDHLISLLPSPLAADSRVGPDEVIREGELSLPLNYGSTRESKPYPSLGQQGRDGPGSGVGQ